MDKIVSWTLSSGQDRVKKRELVKATFKLSNAGRIPDAFANR